MTMLKVILEININQNVICVYMVFSSLRKTQGTPGHHAKCYRHITEINRAVSTIKAVIICQSDIVCTFIFRLH